MRHIEVSEEEYFSWIQWLLFAVVALLSGCQSGVDLRPLYAVSDQAAVTITEIGKAHEKALEDDTKTEWQWCNHLPDPERITCRKAAIDRVFDKSRPRTVAIQRAVELQRILAATLEASQVCIVATNERQRCEKEAFDKAIQIYPDLRALITGLKGKK